MAEDGPDVRPDMRPDILYPVSSRIPISTRLDNSDNLYKWLREPSFDYSSNGDPVSNLSIYIYEKYEFGMMRHKIKILGHKHIDNARICITLDHFLAIKKVGKCFEKKLA